MDENRINNNDEALGARSSAEQATGNTLNEYTVEERDTLADIGRKHNMTWEEIFEANKDIVHDTNEIMPGFKLKIPNRNSL